jgi:hypothetical protein
MQCKNHFQTSRNQLNTLIVVLGLLAGLAMIGFVVLSVRSGDGETGQGLLGICLAIIGYLGGLVTPTPASVATTRRA